MVMCAVVNCSKRSGRDKGVSLYRLPAVISNQCSKTLELSTKRRQLWLSRISRQDLTVEKLDNARVCNLHFINGKPSHLFQELSPDWAPSLNLGHNKVKSTDISTVRYERASKRKAVKAECCATVRQVHKTNVHPPVPVPCMSLDGTEAVHDLELQAANDIEFPLSVSCQTSIETSNAITQTEFSSFEIDRLLDEIQALRSEKHTLNERLLNGVNFSADAMKDEAKVKFYTGLPNFAMLMALFNYCASFISSNHHSALPKFEELMIVLMRLRLNLQMQDIAFRFQISQPTVSRIFSKWLDVLYFRLKPLIRWPLREHGLVRMKYSILSGTLSIETVTTRKGMDCPQIDKITTICCALSNMCEGVVPLE